LFIPSRVWFLTARTLGSWVRIPLDAWMYVGVCLSHSFMYRYRPCDGPVPSPKRVLPKCLKRDL